MTNTITSLVRGAAVALVLVAAPSARAEDTAETQNCMTAIQDNISQDPSDPDAKHWPEDDLRRLCQSQAAVSETIACFTDLLKATGDRALAISSCSKLHAN